MLESEKSKNILYGGTKFSTVRENQEEVAMYVTLQIHEGNIPSLLFAFR